ncbi:serine/threonine-protein kinase par-1 isoform X8 [Drosophila teissieri]|uniref:serine/threonine-protein kinase par-1 isoform X8 n=1 Tax=Drosophila teissieri TaxID=7243 RepID=UPI001CB9E69F|nr:serine/threonine-protein kinase par-1 isoform X8 [Drosophila teissieri]
MVISKPDGTAPNGAAGGAEAAAPAGLDASGNSLAHPSGIPQDQIDNIMSGIANTGNVKMNNHRKKLRQRFDIIKKLGQGTYGKVQLGINKETGQEVAIKTIKKCKIEAEADLVRIRREVQIMSSVHHPNIIHIYEVFENREKMVLVMEFAAGGELYDYLSERKVLTEEEARRIFRQVATAVYYCHKHKICHRDLKLENILLDEKGNAKIADFGLSNVFDDQRLLGTFCGSPLYASPEIVEGTPYQGPEVDCWSLGVLLYTLVYGSMPFDGSNFKRLVKQISQGDYYEPRKPSRASTLIRDMLTVCPRKRASIEQICSHWWVNENDNVSCLDLAEDLANQTPVRLDVLLSLTPATITADQLVVPSAEGAAAAKAAANERVPRSHSVGSIRDMGPPNTEAERRILDMVAAGGEAALMPSPTRTITPAQSPVQTKRKLQPTVSTENAAGTTAKKKEKPANSSFVISKDGGAPLTEAPPTIIEPQATLMEAETIANIPEEVPLPSYSQKDMQAVGDLCDQLMGDASNSSATTAAPAPPAPTPVARQATRGKLDAVVETPEERDATKVIKKFVNKHKTADLVNAINESASKAAAPVGAVAPPPFIRKCSLQDESTLNKFNAERRKSRILETAEKFQPPPPVAAAAPEKPKKLSIPGVSVGSFKKEFEKKATNPPAAEGPTPGELRAQEQVAAAAAAAQEAEALNTPPPSPVVAQSLEGSDSKNSVASISLDEARRSMENSIALLLQAQNESSNEVDQLCAQTETIGVSEPATQQERERKLKNARAIIGNAIQPASPGAEGPPTPPGAVKTSTASITLKSATLPRRKINAKAEVQLDIKPRIPEQGAPPQPAMRFSTEMQHPVADLRSAPPREGPIPYSPIKTTLQARATSLEPKEHVITIQRPPTQHAYGRTSSNTTTRSGSLSRQSTVDSESEGTTTATNMSQATITSTSQPIKKSPREFIIPIAVEGGGFITPRERSVEPSESSHTTSSRSTFTRLRPSRRIGSLLSEAGFDEGSPFQKMRTTSITRDGVSGGAEEEARFTPHRLRSSRPVKKISQDNDSQSSNEEDDDDDDGFEILTAENLFSTLLQRVRALTNRLNVNSDLTVGFPSHSSRLLTDISRQAQSHSPFWSQGSPFASRLNSSNSSGLGAPWRHSMSRDLGSDMESMFSRTGATLPRVGLTTLTTTTTPTKHVITINQSPFRTANKSHPGHFATATATTTAKTVAVAVAGVPKQLTITTTTTTNSNCSSNNANANGRSRPPTVISAITATTPPQLAKTTSSSTTTTSTTTTGPRKP